MYTSMKDELTAELNAIREAGTYKNERPILTPQSNAVSAASARDEEGRDVLNFCANNYLGLADHPELIASAKRALDERGFGMASVRFICGTQDSHKQLEQKLAAFLGMEDAILYSSSMASACRRPRGTATRTPTWTIFAPSSRPRRAPAAPSS